VAVRYTWPVPTPATVLTPFSPPAERYGAGHLGVDLAAAPHELVVAAAAGTVSFAGPVAGRGVVVVTHADGIRTEYEPLEPDVRAGATVAAGAPLGRVTGTHAACKPASCLHWGARRGDTYLDPLGLVAPLGPVHLLPWSAAAG
jgi:murein DD-endopeptidase MepM/ murein hydrolase activator NlpD